jgi:hypothetical protein
VKRTRYVTEPMTKGRLEELQEMAADAIDRDDEVYGEALSEACSEIERLVDVLSDIAYNTSSSVPLAVWPVDHYRDQMHRAIGLAARALPRQGEESKS